MRKILLSLVLLLFALSAQASKYQTNVGSVQQDGECELSSSNNVDTQFTIDNFSIAKDETREVNVKLTNVFDNVWIFQLIILPSSELEIVNKDVTMLLGSCNLSTNIVGSELRIIGMNIDNTIWNTMTDTPVLSFKVKGVEEGTATLKIYDSSVVYGSTTVSLPDYTATVTVTSTASLTGDVNNDGKIDVSDLNIIINVLLGTDPFVQYPAADLNGDGKVDVGDLNVEVDYLLNQ